MVVGQKYTKELNLVEERAVFPVGLWFFFFLTLLAFCSLDFTALGEPVTVRSVPFGL